jgi:hypothetical protein
VEHDVPSVPQRFARYTVVEWRTAEHAAESRRLEALGAGLAVKDVLPMRFGTGARLT